VNQVLNTSAFVYDQIVQLSPAKQIIHIQNRTVLNQLKTNLINI